MRITRKQGALAALVVGLLAAALVTGLALANSHEGAAASVGLRAKLSGRGQQAAGGHFVATLRGTSLRWSLSYKAGGSAKLGARISSRRARPSRLCLRCAALVRGRLQVSRALAWALTHHQARVGLSPPGATSSPALAGPVTVQDVPTLVITSPKPGTTIRLPTEVSYSTGSIEVKQASGMRLEVYVAGLDGAHVRIPLSESSGTVTLPDIKSAFLVGHRDLTFRLLDGEGVPLPNPSATVVVRDLTIEGTRGG
ncbi:MAG TPA: hypothetical protein VLD16_07525 [Gaiellaceae bacterium]|nr:hypothetical protein [Gaiellaceae bacterium]